MPSTKPAGFRRTAKALRVAVIVTVAFIGPTARESRADEPFGPPRGQEVCSSNRAFCAKMAVEPDSTTMYRVCADGSRAAMWSMRSWLGEVDVSNDGQRLVEHPNGGLLPGEQAPGGGPPPGLMERAALIIYGPSGIVRVIRAGDVLDSPGDLEQTVSHWRWGSAELAENDVIVASKPEIASTNDGGLGRGTKFFRVSDGARITEEQARSIPPPVPAPCATATSNHGACAPRCSVGADAPTSGPWWQGCLLLLVRRLRRTSGGRGR